MVLQEVLEEAIRLRESGQSELSLALLDRAQAEGFQSPWLLDNRARALLALDRVTEACDLWRQLADSAADKNASASAKEMLALIQLKQQKQHQQEVLEEAIRLRESGHAERSLALLERAESDGLDDGWLRDNRARALVELQRHQEAALIWAELEKAEDPTLRNVAKENLQTLALEVEIGRLHHEVQAVAKQFSWNLVRLGPELTRVSAFEYALLEEAKLAREKGSAAVSLALMDWALSAGFQSPWLEDNRARALVALDRVVEACDLWRNIRASTALAEAREAAEEMLHSLRRAEQKQRNAKHEMVLVEQAQSLKIEQGPASAIEHLARGLLMYPDSAPCEQALLRLLGELRQQQDQSWSGLTDWMQQQELSVELFEQLLLVLEAQPAVSGS